MDRQDLPGGQPQLKLETVKDAKHVACPCGGVMFSEKMMFKRISAFVSPTGKEEMYPLTAIVCDSCGKVPPDFNPAGIIPEEFVAIEITLPNK